MAVAALFDVDGTLLARNTAPAYMSHLRRTGQARRRDLARTFYYLLWYKLGLLDVRRALEVTMEFVRGRDEGAMRADCLAWYQEAVRQWIFPEMAALVAAHRREGHVVALLTSATRYLAEPLAADLGIEHLLVTQLVVRDGRFTGEVVTPVISPWLAEQIRQGQAPPLSKPEHLSQYTLTEEDDDRPSAGYLSWRHWLEQQGAPDVQPRRWLYLNFTYQQVQSALAGQGVALARLPLVAEQLQRGDLVEPFGPEGRLATPLAYWLITPANSRARKEVDEFCRWVEARAAQTRLALGEAS